MHSDLHPPLWGNYLPTERISIHAVWKLVTKLLQHTLEHLLTKLLLGNLLTLLGHQRIGTRDTKLLTSALLFFATLLHGRILLCATTNALEQGCAQVAAGRGGHSTNATQKRHKPILVALHPVGGLARFWVQGPHDCGTVISGCSLIGAASAIAAHILLKYSAQAGVVGRNRNSQTCPAFRRRIIRVIKRLEPAQILRHRHIVCVTRFARLIHRAATKPNRSDILRVAVAIQSLLDAVSHNGILSLRAIQKLIWRHALAKRSLSPRADIAAHNLIATIGAVSFAAWANHIPSNRIITATGLNRTQSIPDAFNFRVQIASASKPGLLWLNNFIKNLTIKRIPVPHASKPATGKVPTVGGVFSGLAVINSTVPAGKANRARVVLFNVLSNQADLRCRLALVPIPNDILAVEGLADLLDVVLQAAVGERQHRRQCGNTFASPCGSRAKGFRAFNGTTNLA